MELLTHEILSQSLTCKGTMQITLEEDVNVSDTKPDIDQIIKLQGNIQIGTVTPGEGQVLLSGDLSFSLLYMTSDDFRPLHNMSGKLPFQETIHIDDATPGDEVFCHYELEDCQAELINSRKIRIRALISFQCCQEKQQECQVGVDIVDSENLQIKPDHLTYTRLANQKRDYFRIKDSFELPKAKPSMDSILYYEMTPQNMQTRTVEDGIRFIGDLQVFLLYLPEGEEHRIEYLEEELPFDGVLSCPEIHEGTIFSLELLGTRKSLDIQTDEDGENRVVDLELNLEYFMKFYEEDDFHYLKDAYSTSCMLLPTMESISSKKLAMKNQSTLRLSEELNLDASHLPVLQLCNASGSIKIDEQEIVSDGIQLEGMVELELLYITKDDLRPLALQKTVLPFSHKIDCKGIQPEDDYELQTSVNQINVILLDENSIEAKVSINFCTYVFTHQSTEMITAIEEKPLDMEQLQNMPGLVGLIVDKNNDLWSIAKEYHTTMGDIMELNGLESDVVKPGDRLLLLKKVDML